MARQLSLVSATLITAAVSGLLPVAADHLGSPPPPPPTIMRAPSLPSTVPTVTAPAAVAVVAPSGGSTPANTSLEVPQGGIVILNLDSSARLAFRAQDEARDRTETIDPLFRNTTDASKSIAVTLYAQDRTGREVKCVKLENDRPFSVPAHSATFQLILLRLCDEESGQKLAYPLTGFARLTVTPAEKIEPKSGEAANPSVRVSEPGVAFVPFSISDPPAAGCAATLTFLIPLALTAAVVLITIVSLERKKTHLKNRMGSSTWSFGQSWGANIAIAGALLGAVLTATVFPDHPHFMSRNSYAMLQALFAAIIGLAPLVYALIRYDVVAVINGVVSTDAQGYVIMFLISGGLVLWGAMGQVATLGVLLLEFIQSRSIPEGIGNALLALAALLGVLLIVYGLRSLYQTARKLSARPTPPAPPAFPVVEGMLLSPEQAANLNPPLRTWSVL